MQVVEREDELSRIEAAILRARAGTGGLLLIEGPAGVGKTRLMRSARSIAGHHAVTPFVARGGELEHDLPFGLVRQLFEPLVARSSGRERRRLLQGAAALSLPALGLGPDGTTAAVGGDPAHAALHGLYWLCANLAERGPLLLALDDAHWADSPSLDWVRYLVARLDELPVLVLAAVRTVDPAAGDHMLGELAADMAAERVRPAPLSADAVSTLVGSALGEPPDDAFADACHHVTGGNPFLVQELVLTMTELSVRPTAAAAHRVHELSPGAVADGVGARLARFPRGAEALARAVALLGASAELHHAAALAGLEPDHAASTADALVEGGILDSGRPLRFVHPLVRQSISGRMSESERARGHAAAAAILQQSGAGLDAVAVHLLATEPAGLPSTVDTLARAARAAVARGATDAAIAYLRRALREPPAPHERAAMLLELGSVESGAADPLAIDHLSEAAEIAVDARVRARAHQALAFTLIAAGRVPEVEPAYDRAITAASEVDLGLALELETSLVAAAQMGMMPSTIATERLQRFDRDAITGDRPSERLLLGTLSFEALRRNEPADVAAGLAERALAGTPPPVEGLIESPPLTLALLALMYADRLELPTRIAADAAELAIARGSHRGFVIFSNFRAALSLRAGRLDDAEELGLEILRVEGAYGPGVQLIAASCVAQARVLRGALTGAEAILDDNGITAIAAEDCVLEEPIYARALLRAAQGDTERALEDMLAVGRRLLAVGSFGVAQYCWRSDAALMHAALGQRAEAARLADEQLALARAFGTGRTLGASLRAMGLLEPGDRGIELLTQAVAALDGSPASLEHARALVDLGAALRRSGRRAAAREPLARGREVALRCGALALVDEAGIELQAAGARPRRLMLTGVDALTTSQRRVAEMAARGLRNPEIAQALFISRKTVEMHLSNAYRTLDISSREQLGHALEGDEQKKVSGGSR